MELSKFQKQFALGLRRFPFLMCIAYGFWRRFQARFSAGAIGVIFNQHGEILLVKHAFHTKYPWGLPGGWVTRKEDPAATVRREIREELSLDVEVTTILLVETPFTGHLDLAYLCKTDSMVGRLSFELLDFQWITPENMPPISPFHRKAIHRAQEILQIRP